MSGRARMSSPAAALSVVLRKTVCPAAFGPGDDELHFSIGQPVVVGKLAVPRKRGPRRHVPAQRLLFDGAGPGTCLQVAGQRKRGSFVEVTRHAPLVQDPHDLAVEQHGRADALMRQRGARPQRPSRADQHCQTGQDSLLHHILDAGNQSGAGFSRARAGLKARPTSRIQFSFHYTFRYGRDLRKAKRAEQHARPLLLVVTRSSLVIGQAAGMPPVRCRSRRRRSRRRCTAGQRCCRSSVSPSVAPACTLRRRPCR
jgi:hypothetical protein